MALSSDVLDTYTTFTFRSNTKAGKGIQGKGGKEVNNVYKSLLGEFSTVVFHWCNTIGPAHIVLGFCGIGTFY
jgi:hypothetical protein